MELIWERSEHTLQEYIKTGLLSSNGFNGRIEYSQLGRIYYKQGYKSGEIIQSMARKDKKMERWKKTPDI